MPGETNKGTEAAQDLYQRIIDLGADEDQVALFPIASDPKTAPLLAHLPESDRKRAEAYLSAATRWGAARTTTAERRLAEARKALEEFDLELARGLAARVDSQYLDDEGTAALDQLILDLETRTMELESLAETERALRSASDTKRPPWWRRWRR